MGEIPSQSDQLAAREAIKAKAPELEKKGADFQKKLDSMSDEDIKKLLVDSEADFAKKDVDAKFQEIMNDPVVNPKLGDGKFYLPDQYESHKDIQPLREARDKAKAAIDKAREDYKEKQKEISDAMELQRSSKIYTEEGYKAMAGNRAALMSILDSDPSKLQMEDIKKIEQKLAGVNGSNIGIQEHVYAKLSDDIDTIDKMKFKDSLASVKFASELMKANFKSFNETWTQVDNTSPLYKSAATFVDALLLRAQANASNDAAKFDQSKAMMADARGAVDKLKLREIRIGVPGAAPADEGPAEMKIAMGPPPSSEQ